MTDTDYPQAFEALANAGVSAREGCANIANVFQGIEFSRLQDHLFHHSVYGYEECIFLAEVLKQFPPEAIDTVIELSLSGHGAKEALAKIRGGYPPTAMADGTPIVDAEPFEFRHNGLWYRADGTPVDEGEM